MGLLQGRRGRLPGGRPEDGGRLPQHGRRLRQHRPEALTRPATPHGTKGHDPRSAPRPGRGALRPFTFAGPRRTNRSGDNSRPNTETVRAAHARPRRLFPLVSHGVVYFGSCTGMPAVHVGGQVHPQGADGRYRVAGPKGVGTLGRGRPAGTWARRPR
ncbi:DUF6193 family natural product biosynthesis protein [Streptomyces sp. NPDC048266]|uniref:DUF6193 family natural product biosynthesis protein n=1 Tax=Streptomyces sp. NPDC048266 TaxID=3155787 RepID=UPI0033FF1C4B